MPRTLEVKVSARRHSVEVIIRKSSVIAILLLSLCSWGCATDYCPDSGVGLGNTCGQTNTTAANGSGQMYVSNTGSSSIERFALATTIQGNVVPAAAISGGQTQLSTPYYLTLDTANDRMYVPNTGNSSITVYGAVSTEDQNIAPTRQISGAATQLNRPTQIEFDTTNNLLYVANPGSLSVLVFANATTTQGNVAPTRVLSGGATKIAGISSIHLDTANDRLWVVDPTASALLVYDSASTLNGAVPPTRTISGPATLLTTPQYLLQTGTTLFVSCKASIVRFDDANTVTGNEAPAARLIGSNTALVTPTQMVYNSGVDELYVADNGASSVLVFASASNATANPFPSRILNGSSTGYSGPTGLALDLTR